MPPANAGGNNWAVGGYRTDQILDTVNDQYLAGNGLRADPDALYYITGGGNTFSRGVSSVRPPRRLPPAVWSTA